MKALYFASVLAVVSAFDLQKVFTQDPQQFDKFVERVFDQLDSNNDELITEVEYQRVVKYAKQANHFKGDADEFSDIDKDDDGKVTLNELKDYWKADMSNVDLEKLKEHDTPETTAYTKRLFTQLNEKSCSAVNAEDAWKQFQDCASRLNESCSIIDCGVNGTELTQKRAQLQAAVAGQVIGATVLAAFAVIFFTMLFSFWIIIGLPLFLATIVGEVFLIKKLVKDASLLHQLNKEIGNGTTLQ